MNYTFDKEHTRHKLQTVFQSNTKVKSQQFLSLLFPHQLMSFFDWHHKWS